MYESTDKALYPIGPYPGIKEPDKDLLETWIETIRVFPKEIKEKVEGLSKEELTYTYRSGGWNVAQVVNHCADSHMNSLMRFKLALTEDAPQIRPYHEDRWAELSVGQSLNLTPSLAILAGVHEQLHGIISQLNAGELEHTFVHPEHSHVFTLQETIGLYAWHCAHHLAHVAVALNRRSKG